MWAAAGIVRETDPLLRAADELEMQLRKCDAEMDRRGAGLGGARAAEPHHRGSGGASMRGGEGRRAGGYTTTWITRIA